MPPTSSARARAVMGASIAAGGVFLLGLIALVMCYVRRRRKRYGAGSRHHHHLARPPKRPKPQRRVAFIKPPDVPKKDLFYPWAAAQSNNPCELATLRSGSFPAAATEQRSGPADVAKRTPALAPGSAARPATPGPFPPGAACEPAAVPPPAQWPLRDDEPLPRRGRHGDVRSVVSWDDEETTEPPPPPAADSLTPLSLPSASRSRDALLEPGRSAANSPTPTPSAGLPTPLKVSHWPDALLDESAFASRGGANRNTFGQEEGGFRGVVPSEGG